jgi:hypothetical protein
MPRPSGFFQCCSKADFVFSLCGQEEAPRLTMRCSISLAWATPDLISTSRYFKNWSFIPRSVVADAASTQYVSNRLVSLYCLRRRPRSNTPSARVPSRAPVESVSPSPRDKDRECQPENRERELDIDPPRRMSTTPGAGRDRPGSSTTTPRLNAKKKTYGAALYPTSDPAKRYDNLM